MQTSKALFRIVTLILAATLITACSKEAKKTRLLAEADELFQSGDYDKAKVRYLNVRATGPAKRTRIRKNRSDVAGGRSTAAGRCIFAKASELDPRTIKIEYDSPDVIWP